MRFSPRCTPCIASDRPRAARAKRPSKRSLWKGESDHGARVLATVIEKIAGKTVALGATLADGAQ
jgi:hypothetical protein